VVKKARSQGRVPLGGVRVSVSPRVSRHDGKYSLKRVCLAPRDTVETLGEEEALLL